MELDDRSSSSRQQTRQLEMILRQPRTLSSLKTRWFILFLCSIVLMCTYFSYDIPASLHQHLMDYMPPSTEFEVYFNMLYSFYSIPNIILPFFGGSFVDRIGSSFCFFVFASLTLLGQLFFAIGIVTQNWGVMLLGRTIYGFGGESACVASSTLLAEWFVGKEVAFAMAICLSISRTGSVINNMVSPVVANDVSTPAAVWLGVLVNAVAAGAGAIVVSVSHRAKEKLRKENRSVALLTASLLEDRREDVRVAEEENSVDDDESQSVRKSKENKDSVHFSDVKRFGVLFWLLSISCLVVYGCVLPFNNVASGILLERSYFTTPPADCTLLYPDQCTYGTLQPQSNPSTDSNNNNTCPTSPHVAPVLPSSLNVTQQQDPSWHQSQYVYPTLTPADVDCGDPFWSQACTQNYCDAQNTATETAGRVMSIPYLLSAALSPLFGLTIDKIGRRAMITSLAPLILIPVHVALAISTSSPIGPLIGQGIAYALYAAVIWPSVPLTVEARLTGTAYGVITSVQNIGLALFPLVIAGVYNAANQQYIPAVEFFFVSCAILGVCVGVLLNVMDRRYGGRLNKVNSWEVERVMGEEEDGEYVAALVPLSDAEYI